MRPWILPLMLTLACAPPEAPTELSDLSRYLYQAWDDPDERTRQDGLQNLEAFLADVDLAADPRDRAWTLEDLTEEDVATITRPDRPLENCFGLGMAFQSRWPAVEHAQVQILADQLPAEPSAEFYDRTFTNVDDPSCFPDASCPQLDTVNDMLRKNALYSVESTLLKNFRWVDFVDTDGNERTAFYSRSWYDKSWDGDKERTTIWQSYSIDLWLETADGAVRYQTLWNETELLGNPISDDLAASTVVGGTEDIFKAGDDAILTLFHPDEVEAE